MRFEDLPQTVKNHLITRFVFGGLLIVLSIVFWIVFKSFVTGCLPFLLAAAYILYLAVTMHLSLKRDGLFFTDGKLVRIDRTVNNERIRKLYNKTDTPRAFYLLTENKTSVKVRPDGRKWRYEVGDWLRVYYLKNQTPRSIDGGLVFFDYLLYEQLTIDSEEMTAE